MVQSTPLPVSELRQAPQAPRIWAQISAHHSRRLSLICLLLGAACPLAREWGRGDCLRWGRHLQGALGARSLLPLPWETVPQLHSWLCVPRAPGLCLGSGCPSALPVSLLLSVFVPFLLCLHKDHPPSATWPVSAFLPHSCPSLPTTFLSLCLCPLPLGVSECGDQAGLGLGPRVPGWSSPFGKFCDHTSPSWQGDRGSGW